MSVSGPEALKSLEEALRDIRREEDEIAKRLSRSADLVNKMREQESDLFRQLAAVRLDPATQADLVGRLTQAESKARDMLKQHGDSLSGAEARLEELDASIAALTAERAQVQSTVQKRQTELAEIGKRVEPQLTADPTYVAKRKAAAELHDIATGSMAKTTQAEADREQKGRPYRDDPLFMYLWERGYSTRNYRANNLVVWLDGMVARLVGFADARPNFAMLNEIPLRLREHAERQMANATAAEEEVDALVAAAIDAAGGRPVREALQKAEARIAEIDAGIVTAEDARDETAKAQRELAQGSDVAFTSAVSTLAEALGREDVQVLLEEARATKTGRDDTIVKQIDDVRQRAAEEEGDQRDQKARLKTLASRRRELEDISYEFKKQGFDNPGSSFGEEKLVGDLLNDFLRGGITAAAYWDQWRRSQNGTTTAPRNDWNFDERFGGGGSNSPWGGSGGFKWPDNSFGGGSGGNRSSGNWGRLPGGSGSTGGFSRPRTGSMGTRTGGGFKTGGGF